MVDFVKHQLPGTFGGYNVHGMTLKQRKHTLWRMVHHLTKNATHYGKGSSQTMKTKMNTSTTM